MSTRPGTRNTNAINDDPDKYLGRVINGMYRLESFLDGGGMGLVFKATRLNFKKPVVVKILRPSLSKNLDIVKRFQREIDLLSVLSHPSIVSILDLGRDASGFSYFVMDFVEGETMDLLCDKKELSLAEIFEIFRQICSALSEAHAKDIIHRDIKFENIVVRRLSDGRLHATLLDFGVARDLKTKSEITRVGELPGTPGIIAPELVEDPCPSPASDLYSIGVLLFIAITGRAPFSGDNDFQIVQAHQRDPIPDIRSLVDNDVPEQVVELIYELMQKDAKKRPQSAQLVRDRIESITRHSPAVDVSRSWKAYVPPDDVSPSSVHDESPLHEDLAVHQHQRVTPASIVGMLIALLIILVLVVVYLLYRQMLLSSP